MKLIKLISFDLRRGVRQEWAKLAFSGILAFCCCWLMAYQYYDYMNFNGITEYSRLSVMDFIIYNFRGMRVYSPDLGEEYRLPAVWLIYQVFISLIVGYYPVRDLAGYGKNTLLRTRSRITWFLSKIIWTLCMVLVYYLIIFLAAVFFSLVSGNSLSFFPTYDATLLFGEIDLNTVYVETLTVYMIFIPFLISAVMSIVQVVASYIVSPFVSFIGISVFMVACTYVAKPWLVGNGSMILRTKFHSIYGFTAEDILLWLLIYLLSALIVGFIYFSRKDILRREN